MKKYLLYFFYFLVVSCSVSKSNDKKGTIQVRKIVFDSYMDITKEGKENIVALENEFKKKATDSDVLGFSFLQLLSIEPKSKVVIEIQKDTMFRYGSLEGREFDKIKIDLSKNRVYYIDSQNPNNYFDLFSKNDSSAIQIDKKDRKRILGFDCYKIIVEVKEKKESEEEESTPSLGNSIYEFYVTDKINLPFAQVHRGFDSKLPNNVFPLEVLAWSKNVKGWNTIYKVVDVQLK